MEKNKIFIYEVENLERARSFLSNFKDPVILTNGSGAIYYYGILVLFHIFKILKSEFPQIIDVRVNFDNNLVAKFSDSCNKSICYESFL